MAVRAAVSAPRRPARPIPPDGPVSPTRAAKAGKLFFGFAQLFHQLVPYPHLVQPRWLHAGDFTIAKHVARRLREVVARIFRQLMDWPRLRSVSHPRRRFGRNGLINRAPRFHLPCVNLAPLRFRTRGIAPESGFCVPCDARISCEDPCPSRVQAFRRGPSLACVELTDRMPIKRRGPGNRKESARRSRIRLKPSALRL